MQTKPAILWGGKGQAKVMRPILEAMGYRVVAHFDSNTTLPPIFNDLPIRGDWQGFCQWREQQTAQHYFAVCVGSNNRARVDIHNKLITNGLIPVTAVHHRAWVADSATLGHGSQILAGAMICEHAVIGAQTIVNTRANVDHDCVVGKGVHIMGQACIAGEVIIEDFVSIGSNATILPRLHIGAGAFVGAGAVVTHDVPENIVVAGNPARALYLEAKQA